jgi:hypothetical protein
MAAALPKTATETILSADIRLYAFDLAEIASSVGTQSF